MEIAGWNNFQAKQSVNLGNWMTINIMLIHWDTYVNNHSPPFVLWICNLLWIRWKVEDIWVKLMRWKLRGEITFKQNKVLIL